MSGLMKPCIECGELSDRNRCAEHRPKHAPKASRRERGYDAAWDRLSARARRIQPFCSDCGTTDDLTADHSPEAWERKAQGKPIRLQDVDVLCRGCNARRGAARGPNTRGQGVGDTVPSPHAKAEYLLLRVSGTSGEVV